MTDHQTRVLEEKKLMDDKLVKLVRFISASPLFDALPELDKALLRWQRKIMEDYSEVLGERVALFDLSQTESVARCAESQPEVHALASLFKSLWNAGSDIPIHPYDRAAMYGLLSEHKDTTGVGYAITDLGRAAIKLAESKNV